jgi:ammonium transporter, Amt family
MKALGQLGKQALAMVVVGLYAFAVSYGLATLIERFMGFRVSAEDEVSGVDLSQHAETAYTEGGYGHQQVHRPSLGERDALRPRPSEDEID